MSNKRKKPSPQMTARQTKNTHNKFSKEELNLGELKRNYATRMDNIALIQVNQDLAAAIRLLIEKLSQTNGEQK